jgi:histidyl-tRNA synthetase
MKNSTMRSSYSLYNKCRQKHEESFMHYCQKLRRIKISKALKVNVRNAINSQFKSSQNKKINLAI